MSFMEEFHHLRIRLEDIISATDNFHPNRLIGHGGFGPVYKGELSLPEGPTMVAFKRLDRKFDQGSTEFWKEVMMLSKYKHENLVSLLHFCAERDEMILVYEYASRGSLDRYLSDANLSWNQRLKICVEVAHALNYLHDPMETQQRVIHRDVKSSNILLDEDWTARVSDFGLSKVGPANQVQTFLISNAVGTPGYCDPLYWETGFLSKESDVYSFGVVLFEVMCGRLCYDYLDGKLSCILVHEWKKCYDENRLDDIVFRDLKDQIDQVSLMTFSSIAHQCLSRDRKERPAMAEIVKQLEVALHQNNFVQNEVNLDMISELAIFPPSIKSWEKYFLLSKGILVDEGKTWLSINRKGEICEMISAIKCISGERFTHCVIENSRFSNVLSGVMHNGLKVKVRTQFLSPNVTYIINLVFKHTITDLGIYVPFKYKLEGETSYVNSCIAQRGEDGWLMTELYQFTSCKNEHRFKIKFLQPFKISSLRPQYLLQGIEFRPVDHETHENLGKKNNVATQSLTNSDIDWERTLPSEYMDVIKLSNNNVQSTTNKELYFLLRKGLLIHCGKMWYSISKNMKKRIMIPASEFLLEEEWIWKSLPESRFELVAESPHRSSFSLALQIKSRLLLPQATYSCHLIYKLPEYHSLFKGIVIMKIKSSPHLSSHPRFIYLNTPPHTPIIGHKVDVKTDGSSYTHKIKGHPKLRKDDWMEFQLWEVSRSAESIQLYIQFRGYEVKDENNDFVGLIVQGIELRPL